MALVHCSECDREISSQAPICPGCGAPMARTGIAQVRSKTMLPSMLGGFFKFLGVLVIIVFGLGYWSEQHSDRPAPTPQASDHSSLKVATEVPPAIASKPNAGQDRIDAPIQPKPSEPDKKAVKPAKIDAILDGPYKAKMLGSSFLVRSKYFADRLNDFPDAENHAFSSDQIYRAYKLNSIDADNQFRDKATRIFGIVTKVTKLGLSPTILMLGEDGDFRTVQVSLNDIQACGVKDGYIEECSAEQKAASIAPYSTVMADCVGMVQFNSKPWFAGCLIFRPQNQN